MTEGIKFEDLKEMLESYKTSYVNDQGNHMIYGKNAELFEELLKNMYPEEYI